MRVPRRYVVALVLTALVTAAQFLFWLPPLTDAAGDLRELPSLDLPILYVLLAPISNTLDFLTFLTVGRAKAVLVGAVALYAGARVLAHRGRAIPPQWRREVRNAAAFVVALLALGAAAAALPRPVPRLAASSQYVVADYHTHTELSHDGRGGWSAADADRWHARQGFNVWFETEHNTGGRAVARSGGRALPGIELSVYRLHVVALGAGDSIDRGPYERDIRGMLRLFPALHAQRRVAIASLPEYRRAYWEDLDALVAAGLDGFEIVSCAPKAIGFPGNLRESVVETARWHSLLVVGASDNHGWGRVTCVWNLVATSPDSVLDVLRAKSGGAATNHVVARTLALAAYPTWLTAIAGPWTMLRTGGLEEGLAWILWIWIGAWAVGRIRRR